MANTIRTHQAVMTAEVLSYLKPQPGKLYLDATFGVGGHTRAILTAEPQCRVVALDIDQQSLNFHAAPLVTEFGDRFLPVWGNFAHLYRILRKYQISSVAGIVADLGTSQYQIFNREGFSFLEDSPLDMRMSSGHTRTTAADLVNTLSEKELARIIFTYGEDRYARLIARRIVEERTKQQIRTTRQLATLIDNAVPNRPMERHKRYIHPATKTFQALRIAVNEEMENLNLFLPAAVNALEPGGHLVCISFHSLEDRPVKQFFAQQEQIGTGTVLTRKPITPTPAEIAANPSSRSAKLRAFDRS